MTDTVDRLLKEHDAGQLCLGDKQRHRLSALVERSCSSVVWDGASGVPAVNVAVVVLNSATAPRVEALIGSLHENSIVIVPFGENPAFDVLKSRLFAYGSIGPDSAASPHHLWWGGVKPLGVPTGIYRREDTLFVSLCGRQTHAREKASLSTAALDRLGLHSVVETTEADSGAGLRGSSKIDFIIRQWEQTGRPIFWIAAEAKVRQHPVLPQALGCDFAVHKRRSGEMDTGALFFHQTDTARDLLEIWQRLSRSYPDLPEAFLLDQAWALVASQRQIETAWLPDSYWHNGNLGACDNGVVIQCDPTDAVPSYDENLAVRCHRARRFGRHQAPEPHLIMRGPKQAGRSITVVIRDVLAGDALHTSAAIEAIARAFENDPGGFSQMEVVLCAWDEDTESVMRIDDDCWVLVTDPSERLLSDAFARLARSNAIQYSAAPGRYRSNMIVSESAAVIRLADPVLGAKIKRSDRFQRLTYDGTGWN